LAAANAVVVGANKTNFVKEQDMGKVAQRYLDVDPWIIRETGFHPEQSEVSESLFSVGNEFMGVRGYFEEGYSGARFVGSYFNGVFEEADIPHPVAFRSFATRMRFMVNTVDWLHTRLVLDGETLDLAKSQFSGFCRRLDLRTGVLERELVWTTRRGKKLKLLFQRFLSMTEAHLGGLRITFTALNFSGPVAVRTGIDFSPVHRSERKNYWTCPRLGQTGGIVAALGETLRSKNKVFSSFRLVSSVPVKPRLLQEEKYVGLAVDLRLRNGEPVTLDKLVVNHVEKNGRVAVRQVWAQGLAHARRLSRATFDAARRQNEAYWREVWNKFDVEIDGDPANQQGVRFCIFNMHQTYHGVDPTLNIGAKGLTGEIYGGHAFWDTETYCLPFYLFNNPQAARNLLSFRYNTLPGAMERARQFDCEGARYPMCTLDGTESCGVWQHGDLEIHVPAAVAYGIWHYVHVTGDREFLYTQGIEMLLQLSRFFASRGAWSPQTNEFGFWFVMGADEFHMGVNNNCYTNVMAKKTFEWTLQALREMKRRAPARLRAVSRKVGLRPGELADWHRKARKMRILQDQKTGVFEQHDGYFDAPHLDWHTIRPTEFPLYHHWAYDRLFRTDMIKQPDVLLLHFFFSHEFDLKNKRANYEYYEPRCSHESSLSPGVHSILAAELGRHQQAYDYWKYAARLDLDNYNRNTHEGLHTTSMAAAWLNVVYGFGGMRSDGDRLSFNPSLPAAWKSFSFQIVYRRSVLNVRVTPQAVTLKVVAGPSVAVDLFNETVRVTSGGVARRLPARRRAK
jgi:maltose phosphorylase